MAHNVDTSSSKTKTFPVTTCCCCNAVPASRTVKLSRSFVSYCLLLPTADMGASARLSCRARALCRSSLRFVEFHFSYPVTYCSRRRRACLVQGVRQSRFTTRKKTVVPISSEWSRNKLVNWLTCPRLTPLCVWVNPAAVSKHRHGKVLIRFRNADRWARSRSCRTTRRNDRNRKRPT